MENFNKGPMLYDLPQWERPREKLQSCGASSLSDAELIAVLISSGTKNESALSLAGRILALEHGSLCKLSDYVVEEFMQLNGMGIAKASAIVAALELGRRVATAPPENKINVENPDDIARLFMDEMKYFKREVFKIALFNSKLEYMGKYEVSSGGLTSTEASPREIFAPAVKRGAFAIALVHNHPSGNPKPSDADILATKKAVSSGEIIGIQVIDHIILGDNCFLSMRTEYKELFTIGQI